MTDLEVLVYTATAARVVADTMRQAAAATARAEGPASVSRLLGLTTPDPRIIDALVAAMTAAAAETLRQEEVARAEPT